MRIGPVIGVMFFNSYNAVSPARCYLLAKGIGQVEPFFPQLTRLIEEGPVPMTALLVMNLLEVSPKPEHTSFFLSSAMHWLERQPGNSRLWVDRGLGPRLAKWLGTVMKSDNSLRSISHSLRAQIDDVLARLTQAGVAEAHQVERSLAAD